MEESHVTQKVQADWVATAYHPWVGIVIACSSCKSKVKYENPTAKFCPNCGAKMGNAAKMPLDWIKALDSF